MGNLRRPLQAVDRCKIETQCKTETEISIHRKREKASVLELKQRKKITQTNFLKNFPQGLDRTEKYDKISKRLENKLMFTEGSP